MEGPWGMWEQLGPHTGTGGCEAVKAGEQGTFS